jgi:uncharacterized protein (DUF2164 family)
VDGHFVKEIQQYLTKEEKIISQLKKEHATEVEKLAKKFKVPVLFVEAIRDTLK